MMIEKLVPVHYFLTVKKVMSHVELLINQPVCPGVFIREMHCQWQNEESVLPGLIDTTVVFQTRSQAKIEGFPGVSRSVIDEGELGLLPSGIPTRLIMSGNFDLMHLFLNPSLFSTAALEVLDIDPTCFHLKEQIKYNDQLILAIGIALKQEILSGTLLGNLYAESLIQTMVVHLLGKHAVFPHSPIRMNGALSRSDLKRVIEYINENLGKDLTLAELAANVHLSAYHLERLFKRATGQSLHQYVIARRVAAAQELIRSGSLPLAEIAGQVGFADQSHLTRNFKRLVGVSPGALLRESKNVQ